MLAAGSRVISSFQLMTRDPAASIQFYTQLFGWKAESMNMGPGLEYTFLKVGDRPAGGLLRVPAEAGNAPRELTDWRLSLRLRYDIQLW